MLTRLTALFSRRVRSQRTNKIRSRRIFLEALENRSLLAAISWDGGANTLNWNDASNWSNDLLPGAADDVTISLAGDVTIHGASGTIKSLTSSAEVATDGGTLDIAAASSVASLTLDGGAVTGTGDLVVSGLFTWRAGTLTGS